MSKTLFSVEVDPLGETLEIHLNGAGLLALRRALEEAERTGDVHLFSESWGGAELSDQLQNPANRLIQHMKVIVSSS